ncbi:DUF6221 family protein [Streptomyces longispororuber]|uniref:DUF6221 family protein n=1 Tax=Streptomyces longispororuber TaxID=68230 RepID=UPI002108E304|nr:DUF6221 family protein [Streptomyces longispororuber]MCQ4207938.1 DUF6221 family protein [Streptomyces longispororuber]
MSRGVAVVLRLLGDRAITGGHQGPAHGHTVDFCHGELAGFRPTIALHVTLHDPARALREVEAKRRVLARHTLSPATGDPELPWDNRDDCQFDGETWPCEDLLDLASPYADHPDCPRPA